MYYVYILKRVNDTYYIGFSSNLKQRIQNHLDGKVGQTKSPDLSKLVPQSL